jgi:hypothetical protein
LVEVAVAAVKPITNKVRGVFLGVDENIPPLPHQLSEWIFWKIRLLRRSKNRRAG